MEVVAKYCACLTTDDSVPCCQGTVVVAEGAGLVETGEAEHAVIDHIW